MLNSALLHRLDDQDRALYRRWVIGAPASRAALLPWTLLTHMGGVAASVVLALVPLLAAEGRLKVAALQVAWTLVLSLLVVQAVKRMVVRTRPAERASTHAHAHIPDRFSFPSGHAAAAMSFAYIYAATFHSLAWALLALAVLVGVSRVRLGTHYPGDVLLGQIIAIATGAAVRLIW
jgi:undecaprenyl-diphosphatase